VLQRHQRLCVKLRAYRPTDIMGLGLQSSVLMNNNIIVIYNDCSELARLMPLPSSSEVFLTTETNKLT